jgi:hypothetical protein
MSLSFVERYRHLVFYRRTSLRQDYKTVPACAVVFFAAVILLLSGGATLAATAGDHASAVESVFRYEGFLGRPPGVGDALALADQANQQVSAGSTDESRETPSIGSYGKAFLPDLVDGTKRIFSSDIGPVALVGLGVTGVAFALDHTVDDYVQKHQPLGSQEQTGDKMGQGYVPIGLGVVLFATGQMIDNKQLADTGAVSLEALAVTGVATEALKYITRRQRPNHADNMSFPSGHASMTAAFAASVSEMYDWNPYIAVPLFTASAFVGASRIQANEHHFSDVVAGMALGTVVGMGVGRNRKEKNDAGTVAGFSVAPLVDSGYRGIIISWRF